MKKTQKFSLEKLHQISLSFYFSLKFIRDILKIIKDLTV